MTGQMVSWLIAKLDEAERLALANDPDAVLRRIVADRKILELHGMTTNAPGGMPACIECGTHDEYPRDWPCGTVLALAEGWGWTIRSSDPSAR